MTRIGNMTVKAWRKQQEQIAASAEKLVRLSSVPACPVCAGTGRQPEAIALRCAPCGGMGVKVK